MRHGVVNSSRPGFSASRQYQLKLVVRVSGSHGGHIFWGWYVKVSPVVTYLITADFNFSHWEEQPCLCGQMRNTKGNLYSVFAITQNIQASS